MILRALKHLALVLSAGLLMRACVVQTFQVSGVAMLPAVAPGDVVLVSKVAYGIRIPGSGSMVMNWNQPNPGELVVVTGVGDPPVTVIRRLVASPGTTVRLERGMVSFRQEGQALAADCRSVEGLPNFCFERLNKKDFLVRLPIGNELIKAGPKEVTLKPGEFYVLADDRRDGPDSRHFGPVPAEAILGKVERILMPADIQGEDLAVDRYLATPLRARGWLWPVL